MTRTYPRVFRSLAPPDTHQLVTARSCMTSGVASETEPVGSVVPTWASRASGWRMGSIDTDVLDYLLWARDTKGLAANTLRVREQVLRRLGSVLDKPLRDAEVGHLLRWEQTEVAGRSAETRRAYVAHVSAFYKWALRTGVVTDNPAVMLTRPKMPKPLPRPISEDDLRTAIEAASPKLAAMLVLAAYAGLRCLEIAQLTWADVTTIEGQHVVCVRHGKGDRDRMVPVGPYVIETIRRHGAKTRGPVFLGLNGRQIQPHSVSQVINDHLRRLGIPATAHKLRARYGTVVAHSSRDLTLAAELCGWASTETAKHYVLPNRKLVGDVLDSLELLARP
jgi:integrase